MEKPTAVFLDEVSIFPNAGAFIDMLRIMGRYNELHPELKEKLKSIAQAGQPIEICNGKIA